MKDDGRPGWDETWMALAVLMSRRSGCPSGAGAVIVDSKQRVVSTGYTGPPASFRHHGKNRKWDCVSDCPRQMMRPEEKPKAYGLECPTAHAEQNAISFADRSRTEEGTMYVSTVPCEACTKMIANSGVARVVWRTTEADEYRGSTGQQVFLARDCGIEVSVVR